jgi:hypothetical protein
VFKLDLRVYEQMMNEDQEKCTQYAKHIRLLKIIVISSILIQLVFVMLLILKVNFGSQDFTYYVSLSTAAVKFVTDLVPMWSVGRIIKNRLSYKKGNEISKKSGINTLKRVRIPLLVAFALLNFKETISSLLYRT